MLRCILLLLVTVATVNAFHGYYTELGPWGLESAIIKDVKSTRKDKNIKEVKNTNNSRKSTKKDKNKVEEVKNDMNDELEQAEEAFFRAEQKLEGAIVHALDDEVETFFPHHASRSEE